MSGKKLTRAVLLDDGGVLVEQPDGSFRPVADRTDHARLAKLTDADIAAAAKADPDNPPLDDAFWARAMLRKPRSKKGVFLRLDPDVLAWFRRRGSGYQTRINAVLRAFVEAQAARHR
jgi:uncharacterized protein (DUF4415 family)